MERNIGFMDFVLRIFFTIFCMALAAGFQSFILGTIGLGAFITALSGWDPLYTIFGVNTDNTY